MFTALLRYLYVSFVEGGSEEQDSLGRVEAKPEPILRERNRDQNHDKKR